ncbi:MAG TPA: hypothetical protein VHM19_02470 [Polyangiales bacterium]|jgi:hypothetical protein|nr:hypothetical protein [Polyangiales bacterium]
MQLAKAIPSRSSRTRTTTPISQAFGAWTCASCGGREDLRPLDEEGLVLFCAECRDISDIAGVDEFLLELGGAG